MIFPVLSVLISDSCLFWPFGGKKRMKKNTDVTIKQNVWFCIKESTSFFLAYLAEKGWLAAVFFQSNWLLVICMYQLILVKPQPPRCLDLGHAVCCYFSHANDQVCPSIHSMMEIRKFYRIKLMTNSMRGHLFISQIKPQQDPIVPE